MPPLKPIAEIIAQSEKPVYLICPDPEWPYFDLKNFPAPLAEWMAQHYPDVAISLLTCFALNSIVYVGDANEDKAISDLTRSPIFLIGFNEAQAAHFAEAWKNPPLNTPESPNNFYFITCGGRETLNNQEKDFDLDLILIEESLLKQASEEVLDGEVDLSRMKDAGLPLPENR